MANKKTVTLSSEDELKEKINQIYEWVSITVATVSEIKEDVTLLNNSVQELTKAIINNEECNRSNVNNLVDALCSTVGNINKVLVEENELLTSSPKKKSSSTKKTTSSAKRKNEKK